MLPDSAGVAGEGARFIADLATRVVAARGRFALAVSGGRTPWAMFAELRAFSVPWDAVTIYQVDERIAPKGDPDRNLTHLRESLGEARATVEPMPVEDPDAEAAASRYATALPERFDLVHLGLGPDGHTASLVPDDPVLAVEDRLVAVTDVYSGRRRMTLTYPALRRADQLLWLVTGDDKAEALGKLVAGDRGIPAGRVEASASVVLADAAAAGGA